MAKEKDSKDAKAKQEAKPKPEGMPQQKAPKREAKGAGAAPVAVGKEEKGPTPRLAIQYKEKVVPDLMQKFGYKTVMQVPRIRKITINMGVARPPPTRRSWTTRSPTWRASPARSRWSPWRGARSPTSRCAPASRWAAW